MKYLSLYDAHPGGVNCLMFIGNDKIVSGGEKNEIKIWELNGSIYKYSNINIIILIFLKL